MSIVTPRRSISLPERMVFSLNSSLRPNSYVVAIKGKIQFCLVFHIKKFDRNETLLLQLRNESINLHDDAC